MTLSSELSPVHYFLNMMKKPKDAPDNWMFNANIEHKDTSMCCCIKCIRDHFFFDVDEDIAVGDPVQVHEAYSVEFLKELGYVGVYNK